MISIQISVKEITMLKIYKLSYYIFPLMLGFLSMDTIVAINVYGPGGPAPAVHEAAIQFKNKLCTRQK